MSPRLPFPEHSTESTVKFGAAHGIILVNTMSLSKCQGHNLRNDRWNKISKQRKAAPAPAPDSGKRVRIKKGPVDVETSLKDLVGH